MTNKFIFWAQAIDNTLPDHIECGGELLAPAEVERRQQAVSNVSGVIKAGNKIFDENGVRLTVDKGRFVLEVFSVERDIAGRLAPIVCFSSYDSTDIDTYSATVISCLEDFAKRIERNIPAAHQLLVKNSFKELKKKSWAAPIVRTAWMSLVMLALFMLVYMMSHLIA